MDQAVEKELVEMEKRLLANLQTLVTSAIASGFKDVKDTITELFNKDIGFIREWQDTFKGYHKTHFEETIKLHNEITGMRESIVRECDEKLKPVNDKMDDLEKRQTKEEAVTETKEKVITERKNTSFAIWSLVIAASVALGGLIVWLIENVI